MPQTRLYNILVPDAPPYRRTEADIYSTPAFEARAKSEKEPQAALWTRPAPLGALPAYSPL